MVVLVVHLAEEEEEEEEEEEVVVVEVEEGAEEEEEEEVAPVVLDSFNGFGNKTRSHCINVFPRKRPPTTNKKGAALAMGGLRRASIPKSWAVPGVGRVHSNARWFS